jgi:hypothetical protein
VNYHRAEGHHCHHDENLHSYYRSGGIPAKQNCSAKIKEFFVELMGCPGCNHYHTNRSQNDGCSIKHTMQYSEHMSLIDLFASNRYQLGTDSKEPCHYCPMQNVKLFTDDQVFGASLWYF